MVTIPRIALAGMLVIAGDAVVLRSAVAHPGGLDANGCHHDRKRGGDHCHRSAASSSLASPASSALRPLPRRDAAGTIHYANCSAARAAGATPVRRGDPGYARHLDRDGDGVGCE